MRFRSLLSVCAAVMLSAGMFAPPSAQAAPGSAGMDVWNWNITGAGHLEGGIDNAGSPAAVDAVVNPIKFHNQRPDVILLQEVCGDQFTRMNRDLTPLGYTVHWRAVRNQSRCTAYGGSPMNTNSSQLGDLVAVPTAYGPTIADYDFDQVPGAPVGDGQTCLLFSKQSRQVVACSTQLSGTEEQRRVEALRMNVDQVKPWVSQGLGVIIGGDFNSEPLTVPMNNLFDSSVSSSSHGVLFEADMRAVANKPLRDSGRWTHDGRNPKAPVRKIDYVFFSGNYFPRSTFTVNLDKKATSYHRFYAASVAMR